MAGSRFEGWLTHHGPLADPLAGDLDDDAFSLLQPYAASLQECWLLVRAVAPGDANAHANQSFLLQPPSTSSASAPAEPGGIVGISPASGSLADDNGDIAMGANLARGTYGVDGTGIKIGILSDSFNLNGGEAADITAGNLPAASDIHILKDGPSGVDEGRAMAQLIYKVAPGAQIYFYTAADGLTDFAAGIQACVTAGCNVIVDDYVYYTEPFFQDGDAVQTAIANAVQNGVSYFTAADNAGNHYYQHGWVGITATLPGGVGSQTADNFGTAGSPNALESIALLPGTTLQLSLQWDQPFATIGGASGSDDSLSMYLFNNSGTLVASAINDDVGGDPSQFLAWTNSGSASATYQLAIVDAQGPAPNLFKVINFGAGAFNDPNAGIGSGTVIGHAMVPLANTVGAVNYANTSPFGVATPTPEAFSAAGPGEFLFDGSGNRLASPVSADKVNVTAPDGTATSVFPNFLGTSAAAANAAGVAALMLQADPGLTPAQVTSDITSTALAMSGSAAVDGAGFIQAKPAVQRAEQQAACYVGGTRILTLRGELPIEKLFIGDQVITVTGALSVRWIGRRRIDLTRHPHPDQVRPIRIRRDAFAKDSPRRDLLLSPDHAVFADDLLIPIGQLVNGGSIQQDRTLRSVHYYHLELDRHAILLAEGLRAESYLDTGNRSLFANTAGPSVLFPKFEPSVMAKTWERDACAPLACDAARVQPVWQRLARRSCAIGMPTRDFAVTTEPDLHIATLAGGIIQPVFRQSGRYRFALPCGLPAVRLRSRAGKPADTRPWLNDRRTLGVRVGRIVLRGSRGAVDIPMDHAVLQDGWWEPECEGGTLCRWTGGDALLPLTAATDLLEVSLVGSMAYRADAPLPRRDVA